MTTATYQSAFDKSVLAMDELVAAGIAAGEMPAGTPNLTARLQNTVTQAQLDAVKGERDAAKQTLRDFATGVAQRADAKIAADAANVEGQADRDAVNALGLGI